MRRKPMARSLRDGRFAGVRAGLGRLGHRFAATRLGRWIAPLGVIAPRSAGRRIALALVLLAAAGYGVMRSGNFGDPVALGTLWRDGRDAVANAGGFRIETVALSGNRQVTREEVLASAGITGRTSLMFLDVDAVRQKLKANPWIADATVLKLYPDRLHIDINERRPFALWQVDGRVSVIADDGTVLEPYVTRRLAHLPFVVGRGAQTRVKDLVAMLDRHPPMRSIVRSAVLVADRRWNLLLKSGLEVKLPEDGAEQALTQLRTLDRDKKLLSRDIVDVDLRQPGRVAVRLSDEAAKARTEMIAKREKREKEEKRKGGHA